jgi:hypothetical protein
MTTDDSTVHIDLREEAGPIAETVAVGAMRSAEVAAGALIFLLVCPPLMILLVAVVLPTAAIVAAVGIVGGVLALPVMAWRHLHHRHDHHVSLVLERYLHVRTRRASA